MAWCPDGHKKLVPYVENDTPQHPYVVLHNAIVFRVDRVQVFDASTYRMYKHSNALVVDGTLLMAPKLWMHSPRRIRDMLIAHQALCCDLDRPHPVVGADDVDKMRVWTAALKWFKARNRRRACIVLAVRSNLARTAHDTSVWLQHVETRVLEFLKDF
jgi:hypothetical protein